MKRLLIMLAVLVLMLAGCVEDSDEGAAALVDEVQADSSGQTQQPEAAEASTTQPTPVQTEEPEETQKEVPSVAETQQGLGEVEDMLGGLGDLGDIDFSE